MDAPFKAHPAADLFPLIDGPEFDALCEDIRVNGLRDPIVRVWLENQGWFVLDGRNRLRACERVGVKPEWSNYGGDDPVAFVISKNLRRRHMNEGQRAMVAARLAKLSHGGDRKSDQAAKWPVDVPTQAEAAALLNVSERSLRRAKHVLEHGDPEAIAAIERGEMKVGTAEERCAMNTRERAAQQREQIKRLVGEGRGPKEIADQLGCSRSTVQDVKRELRDGPATTPARFVGADDDRAILELVREGLSTGEIAKRTGWSRDAIRAARARLGVSEKRPNERGSNGNGSPLAKLVSYAQEFGDAWELVLANPGAIDRATPEQRAELAEHLQALQLSTRRLIKRLSVKETA